MKVALFFDLANWLTDQVSGGNAEIARALEYHREYVSRGHFLNKWRPQLDMPAPGDSREAMLDKLIAEGRVFERDMELSGNSFKALELPSA